MSEFISNYYKRMSVVLWMFFFAALISGTVTNQFNILNLTISWVIFSIVVYYGMGMIFWLLGAARKLITR